MKNLYIFLVVSISSFALKAQYIDSNLQKEFSISNQVSYMVNLDSQADISSSRFIKGKAEKATYVYNKLKSHAGISQSYLRSFLNEQKVKYTPYCITNSIKVTSNKKIFDQLVKLGGIKSVVWDIPTKMSTTWEEKPIQAQRGPDPEWGILKINADKVWDMGYTGQGVIVGGQDTGYDWLVSPLQKKYRGYIADSLGDHNYNWHDAIHEVSVLSPDSIDNPCGLNLLEPCDDNRHGTHTMGTMVGSDTLNAIGVAPGAKWIACRNMERGNGSPSTYLECFEWFLAPTDLNNENPDPSKGPHVINNSWACPEVEGCNPGNWAFMEAAVENLRAAGTVVVVSAGNSGGNCNTVDNPAAIFEGSFSVGATRQSDSISGFSSRGFVSVDSSYRIKPNVSAPGQGVRSVVIGGEYRSLSGTSMAGPHVAGAVALIISANPDLAGEVEIIENILEESAVQLITEQECNGQDGSSIPNATYGYGRIDVLKAVNLALGNGFEFAEIGTEWVYSYINFDGPANKKELTKVTCIGDTIINNKYCKIIKRQHYLCDYEPIINYMYQKGDKIYHYLSKIDSLVLLFDYSLKVGDMYKTSQYSDFLNPSDMSVTVDSIGFTKIDGQEFRAFYVTKLVGIPNSQPTEYLTYKDIFIPEIGSLKSFFQEELAFCDGKLTYEFRCFKNNTFDLKLTTDPDCELITSIKEDELEVISLNPNPTSESIRVIGLNKPTSYTITTAQGKNISKGTVAANQSIDVSYLPLGLYIISFDELKRNLKFVKN